MDDDLRGGAEEGVEEADQNSVPMEVREVVVLVDKRQVDELGIPVWRDERRGFYTDYIYIYSLDPLTSASYPSHRRPLWNTGHKQYIQRLLVSRCQ